MQMCEHKNLEIFSDQIISDNSPKTTDPDIREVTWETISGIFSFLAIEIHLFQ